MLKIEKITFGYSRRKPPVLTDISLSVEPGGVYGLLGRNGVGKSTLLYLIAGALTPNGGQVVFNGENTRRRLPSTMSEIFLVPEEFTLPSVTLNEFARANSRFYPRFSFEDLRRHVETFEISLSDNLGAISMGQKKKAYMCFALAANTSLLMMDEPTNGLDIPGKSAFRRFIASSMNDERAILISTHQVRDIDRLLDHVVIMENNSVLLDRSVSEITSRLAFMVTDSRRVVENALFAQPALGGNNVILPNPGGEETALNLESLFEFALSKTDLLNRQFTPEDEKEY
ncbi:MAG: ABC transporter ATP-binding protein [Paramuribaculum sp.]|nr:ABC transporter ATP-binding protein [Paramuribaculum sp.]MDE6322606.1 ABC transporter ATP-binding protein [Paramuribaculum sp.]MDE6489048.1 ABC transporter ATP-binding protein [Paramuribaculum sp.]